MDSSPQSISEAVAELREMDGAASNGTANHSTAPSQVEAVPASNGSSHQGENGAPSSQGSNSLRNFRFIKKKFDGGTGGQNEATASNGVSESQDTPPNSQGSELSTDSVVRPLAAASNKRVLSTTDEEGGGTATASLNGSQDTDSPIKNGSGQAAKRMRIVSDDEDGPTPEKKKSPGASRHLGSSHFRVRAHEADQESESDDDEFSGNRLVYDSEEEEEGYTNENLTADKRKVLKFFNEGTEQELTGIQGCNKKKSQEIVRIRPFEGWVELVTALRENRQLNTDFLNAATELLRMKSTVTKLMNKCQKITEKMTGLVEKLTSGSSKMMELQTQPASLNSNLKLGVYQMIGLNWLVLMHKQSLNGILADEMGLGKTIQTIAFLAHLKEKGDEGPHLIIVPSSTLENWSKELTLWAPDLQVITYWGSQDERRHLRIQLVQEQLDYDIILTTYNMVISSSEDRVLFKKMQFVYVVFDEAHMLKNMASQRYEQLMKIRCCRKLLLTGTPLQNNLVELMSLLIFVMPGMFAKRKDQLKKMFSLFPKNQDDQQRSMYEKDRIAHAKRIMKPFFLRRLKSEVLTDLPSKTSLVEKLSMTSRQSELYHQLVQEYKERAARIQEIRERNANNQDGDEPTETTESGIGMLMQLRKLANHPLLVRDHYTDKQLKVIARSLKAYESSHKNAVEEYIIQDLKLMSDFDIHKTCEHYRCIENLTLPDHLVCESGKFRILDDMLPKMKADGERVLIFSQFTMMLDILQKYLKLRGFKFLRLDGQTPVQERGALIDQFNGDPEIFLFILSTRAGGLGINLTAANTVILHDLDFNPYNDKQAEDRCHRVGQKKEVKVIRFISEGTIEEGIYNIAQDKLKLEQDVTGEEADAAESKSKKKDVARLLRAVLGVELKETQIGDVNLDKELDASSKTYTEL